MDPDTFRSDIGIEGTDVYWRRRMAVLTGVLVVVAVVAWACTSASGRQGTTGAAKNATPGPDTLVVSLPSPLASPSASGSAGNSASPTASPSGASKEAKGGKDAKNSKDAKEAKAAAPLRPGDPCDPKDLVLSLRGGQQTYAGTAEPTFLLTVVSTGRVDCTVDVGPRMLETRIVSGDDRVWSTADCVSGDGTDIQMLKRGVPYVRTIRWDRHRSGADCTVKRAAALPGTYVAWTHADGLKSSKAIFYLR